MVYPMLFSLRQLYEKQQTLRIARWSDNHRRLSAIPMPLSPLQSNDDRQGNAWVTLALLPIYHQGRH